MSFIVYKVVIAGASGVGKTCLVHRFVDGTMPESTKRTIGVDFSLKKVKAQASDFIDDSDIEDQEVTLQLWDFAGEARFRFFLPSYCRGAKACLLCYDLTRLSSFNNLPEWYNIIKSNADNPIIILVGCKHDLDEKFRLIPTDRTRTFQREYEINHFYETSSKTGYNVAKIFESLMELLYNRYFN